MSDLAREVYADWLRDQIASLREKEQRALRTGTKIGARMAACHVRACKVYEDELDGLKRGAA